MVLAGLLAVTAAAYSFQLVFQAHATSRAEADLAAAITQLAQVEWPAGLAVSDDEMCPNETTRCLTTDHGPDEAVEQGAAALEATGFQRSEHGRADHHACARGPGGSSPPSDPDPDDGQEGGDEPEDDADLIDRTLDTVDDVGDDLGEVVDDTTGTIGEVVEDAVDEVTDTGGGLLGR